MYVGRSPERICCLNSVRLVCVRVRTRGSHGVVLKQLCHPQVFPKKMLLLNALNPQYKRNRVHFRCVVDKNSILSFVQRLEKKVGKGINRALKATDMQIESESRSGAESKRAGKVRRSGQPGIGKGGRGEVEQRERERERER